MIIMNTEIDISKVRIRTKRLLLRPWKLTDLDDFYEYASVDGVGQMAGWLPHHNKQESLEILERFIKHKRTFAIEYNGKVIGSLGIEKYDEKSFPEFDDLNCREIGYVLSKDYWGNGLMPEAVKAVISYLFNVVKLDVILCGHYMSNTQSGRVQEKCGFRHYRYEIREDMLGKHDAERNAIFRKDYIKEKAASW